MKTTRPCPVCSACEADCLHTIRYPRNTQSILPPEYRIMNCRSCGMVFDDFDAGEAVFSRHYALSGKYEMPETAGGGGIPICRSDPLGED